ncbi:MAG: AbrB/MazE/SpoVT family DNA-binding domain-containing protein [Bacilli bacterium]
MTDDHHSSSEREAPDRMNTAKIQEPIVSEGFSKISSKGQVTIPMEIRSLLHMNEGDQLRFVYEDGVLKIEHIRLLSADELYGYFDTPDDDGSFVLDLSAAREERAEELFKEHWTSDSRGE